MLNANCDAAVNLVAGVTIVMCSCVFQNTQIPDQVRCQVREEPITEVVSIQNSTNPLGFTRMPSRHKLK